MIMADLRLGDYHSVLADEEWDTTISDPPYSDRVHRAGALIEGADNAERSVEIGYEALSAEEVEKLCMFLHQRTRGWIALNTSHDLIPVFEKHLDALGRYVFPPLPCVTPGMNVRLQGDGPSNWTCHLIVARPREKRFMSWGTLPGYYPSKPVRRGESIVMGQKPVPLITAIVRDYSRKGELVCDPFAGGGTTAIACEAMGRRFVGAEINPQTHAKALARIRNGVQLDLLGGAA